MFLLCSAELRSFLTNYGSIHTESGRSVEKPVKISRNFIHCYQFRICIFSTRIYRSSYGHGMRLLMIVPPMTRIIMFLQKLLIFEAPSGLSTTDFSIEDMIAPTAMAQEECPVVRMRDRYQLRVVSRADMSNRHMRRFVCCYVAV